MCETNGSNEGGCGVVRCWGSRGGDRFAFAMISLTLDEVDAAGESSNTPNASQSLTRRQFVSALR